MNRYFIIVIFFLTASLLLSASTTKKIYIFYGPYCCVDCFKKMKVSSDSLLKNKIVDSVIVISRTRNNALLKKLIKRDVSKLFPDYPIIFEYIDEDDPWPPKDLVGGFFGKYNVSITPTVLFFNGDKETFISYQTLYKYDFNLIKIIKDKNILK
ncbi:MAG: hypothetical protein WCR42_15470 [bacterium]